MTKVRVGVLRGGPSNEYDVSLKTGDSVLQNLPEEKYYARDIFIARDGVWHFRGIPIAPEKALRNVDVVFNALHGEYGEDGTVQKLMDDFSVPYSGSGALSSAISMNKLLTKQGLGYVQDIKMPNHIALDSSSNIEAQSYNIFRTFPQPSVIKPVSGGSSVGVSVAKSYESLWSGIEKAFKYSPKILIEEYIGGRETTCGVVENFRGEDLYALLPIEIVPPQKSGFFDYDAKYNPETQEICPARFSRDIKEELQRIAKQVHRVLNLRHYSRSDFIVSKRGIYFLEVNALPGLTENSLVPKALAAAGATLPELLDHLIDQALNNR
jgi:D-alanine-D-alanine ligase